MTFQSLNQDEKEYLELLHRYEHDGRVRDRIKAVLLKNEGWKNKEIAQALRIHEETVRQYLTDWRLDEKLRPENGGSYSKLDANQTQVLIRHLEQITYTRVIDICAYIEQSYGVHYTVSGLTKWLHEHDFRYKKPKATPAKADLAKQKAFIKSYRRLIKQLADNEVILFMDSMHPTMATKTSYGWIKKGKHKPIAQSASKTRVNIMGAIELKEMKVISCSPDAVNAQTTVEFFDQLKAAYPLAAKLHLILDRSGYHRSDLVKKQAKARQIKLHYLPAYSPNLNPIERLWKLMNEFVRNNVFFTSPKQFKGAITEFFHETIPKIKLILYQRITDNFQIIKPVPSG
jgi:transposase